MYSSSASKLKPIDYQCSKCALILVDPVVLPCSHRFCLRCINETITSKLLNCPLCRRRFGSWLRLKNSEEETIPSTSTAGISGRLPISKERQLVDEGLWGTIKKHFSDLLLKRLLEEHEHSKAKTDTATLKKTTTSTTTITSANNIKADVLNTKKTAFDTSKTATDDRNTLVARGTDSINIEMTHFRPICLMPLSSRNASEKIIKVPPIRLKMSKLNDKQMYKPARSKFKQKLTSIHRRSAFSIFQSFKSIQTSAANIIDTTDSIITTIAATNCKTTRRKNQKVDKNPIPDVSITPLTSSAKVTRQDTANVNAKSYPTLIETNKKLRVNLRRINTDMQNTNTNGNGNGNEVRAVASLKNDPDTASPLTKKIRSQQEKDDFRLAKLLQEYDDNAHSPSTNRTVRYSLRSRNKSSASSSMSTSSSSLENFNNKLSLVNSNRGRRNCKAATATGAAVKLPAKAIFQNGQNKINNGITMKKNNNVNNNNNNSLCAPKNICNDAKFTRSTRRLLVAVSE